MGQSLVRKKGDPRSAAKGPRNLTKTLVATSSSTAERTAVTIATAKTAPLVLTGNHGTSFIDGHWTTVIVHPVKFGDSQLSFRISGHFYKSKPFATTCVTIHNNFGRVNSPALSESV